MGGDTKSKAHRTPYLECEPAIALIRERVGQDAEPTCHLRMKALVIKGEVVGGSLQQLWQGELSDAMWIDVPVIILDNLTSETDQK